MSENNGNFSKFPLIIAFFGLHNSKVRGRTRIQKEICILKHKDKIPIGIEFKPYFYGPYSDRLSDIVDLLVSTGIVEQSIIRVGFDTCRYDYSLSKKGEEYFVSIKEMLEKTNPDILLKMESNIKSLETMSIPQIIPLAKKFSGISSN